MVVGLLTNIYLLYRFVCDGICFVHHAAIWLCVAYSGGCIVAFLWLAGWRVIDKKENKMFRLLNGH